MKSGLDAELCDIIKRDVGVLNIGLPNMRCVFMLPKTLPVFSRKYPNVKVNIFEGTSAMIDSKLIEGGIDLVFYSKPHKINQHLAYETLAPEELRKLYPGLCKIFYRRGREVVRIKKQGLSNTLKQSPPFTLQRRICYVIFIR